MIERRMVKRRRYKGYTYFPAIDHHGEFIMSNRRSLSTRRAYDIFVDDVDLPTMLHSTSKQV